MPRSTRRHKSPLPSDASPPAMEDTPAARVASSSSLKDLGTDSDPDNRERPVREKLQKTTIDGIPTEVAPSSDRLMPDAGEKPTSAPVEEADPSSGDSSSRGRVRRKRSYEDMDAEADTHNKKHEKHARKKSRDMSSARAETDVRHIPGEAIAEESLEHEADIEPKSTEPNGAAKGPETAIVNGQDARQTPPPTEASSKDTIVSPKNKRNRDQFLQDASVGSIPSVEETAKDDVAKHDPVEKTEVKAGEEPKPKRQRDSGSPQSPENEDEIVTEKTAPASADGKNATGGFANTAVKSPFGALAESKSPQPQTSASAFAASGFSALSSSSTSPFGALGGSQAAKSPFAAAGEGKGLTSFGSSGSTPSAFGSALGGSEKSPFAAAGSASGFGALGAKGFGSASAFSTIGTGKLTNFSGGSGPSITDLGTKPVKPLGAPPDDDEEDDGPGAEDENADVHSPKEDKKDPRFHEQEISTGEEAEIEVFKCRAKLYNYAKVSDSSDKKEWKERGVGDLKLLVLKADGDDSEKNAKARFVMRADKSHRLLLNTPIIKNGKYGTPEGEMPKNGLVFFMGTIDEKPVELLQLKMKAGNGEEMWTHISELQKDM